MYKIKNDQKNIQIAPQMFDSFEYPAKNQPFNMNKSNIKIQKAIYRPLFSTTDT
jgi:hypothetical protein